METTFKPFLEKYLDIWRNSSLIEMMEITSKDYKAREITKGEIIDFGFEESNSGWEQGFQFVKKIEAKWELNVVSEIPLRADEIMVILSASLRIDGKSMDTANLFIQTFKMDSRDHWKLVRSYIEAGIPFEKNKFDRLSNA